MREQSKLYWFFVVSAFVVATLAVWDLVGEDIGWILILGAIMVAGAIINAIIVWECWHGSLSKQLVEKE